MNNFLSEDNGAFTIQLPVTDPATNSITDTAPGVYGHVEGYEGIYLTTFKTHDVCAVSLDGGTTIHENDGFLAFTPLPENHPLNLIVNVRK